jgi:PP-loop superfamily ATP-utilizing enzyme
MEGTTLSEVLNEHRPGLRALEELGVESPLRLTGLMEEEMAALEAEYNFDEGVDNIGCLATRIPYGLPISSERLKRIDQAEEFLRKRGFRQVRARYLPQALKIEVDLISLPRLVQPSFRIAYLNHLRELGFSEVFLDLNGYRTGSITPMRSGEYQS